RGGTMQDTMVYIGKCIDCSSSTIYRLQQGHSRPILEKVEILARIGREEAKLDREWGESLLTAAGHQDVAAIADRIWGGRVIHSIPYNLPPLKHTKLVGRDNEIAHLLRLLSYERGVHFIPVQGMGGVGKTALVLEVAYRCWD